jgi:hypothetical protein
MRYEPWRRFAAKLEADERRLCSAFAMWDKNSSRAARRSCVSPFAAASGTNAGAGGAATGAGPAKRARVRFPITENAFDRNGWAPKLANIGSEEDGLVRAAAAGGLNELAEVKILEPVRTIFGTTISQRPFDSACGVRAAGTSACDGGVFA